MSHPVTTFDPAEDAVLPEDGDLGATNPEESPVCGNCVDVNCFGCEPDDLEVRDWAKHYDTCPERATLYAEACARTSTGSEGVSYKNYLPFVVEKHMESCALILIPPTAMPLNESPFGEPISTYTQEQAVEDGVLVKVERPDLHGFDRPVHVTSAVYAILETPNAGETEADVTVRMVGLLGAARFAVASGDGQFAKFAHRIAGVETDYFAVVDGDGVTVMLPSDY